MKQSSRGAGEGSPLGEALARAARVVAAVQRGESADAVWSREPPPPPMAGRVRDLAWQALRDYGWGDWLLRVFAPAGVSDRLRPLLLVALSALRGGRLPPFAVVAEAVEVAKRMQPAWGGFVNALLRRYLRAPEQWQPERCPREEEAARWRHPAWWIAQIRADYPINWMVIMAAGNSHPPMTLRVRRSSVRAEVAAALRRAGISFTPSPYPLSSFRLQKPHPFSSLPEAVQRHTVIQDGGAQQAALLLSPRPGERLLDACAAPGGKALHLLDLGASDLTLIDSDAKRTAAMVARFPELAVRARVVVGDAREPERWWDGVPYDAILLDVPCSGSGVVRRHPDGKWLRRAGDISELAANQRALLSAVWPLLRAGGRLLYATCSLFRAENDDNIVWFLSQQRDARLMGRTLLLPNHERDGFFYALLGKGW
ncbi:MAG: 16S rRNA (cytosine(967)-C(5))-methyltransferase RsmB [Hydrogenophilus sp.]|nr:16S rRNA (cytosine(967)-C(5))-methyltransferase RsmB [Hydrogenophilus sp.]